MESAGRKAVRISVWLLIGVVALIVGVAMSFQVGGAREREREFLAAPACASVPVKASGCLWEQEFTVESADTNRRKHRRKSPAAVLVPPAGDSWYVTFRRTGPVLSEMEPDDKVVGVIWHGQIVEVRDADGRRQQTSVGPVGWPADRLGGALACIPIGLAAVAGGLWALFARGDRRHTAAATVVRWHGVAIGGAALLTLWAQSANDWPIWAIPAIWGPVALPLLACMTGFVIAALRGELEDDAPSGPQGATPPPPSPTPPPARPSASGPGSDGSRTPPASGSG
ncbi:hypothetical protein ABT121_16530 [Streptomyces sp. NPDC001928]|uniref:hypothetical protein n=1 Tax=Streptomyces sp. NPDC001928 TaxID=3154404 RepID=UPI00332A6A8C